MCPKFFTNDAIVASKSNHKALLSDSIAFNLNTSQHNDNELRSSDNHQISGLLEDPSTGDEPIGFGREDGLFADLFTDIDVLQTEGRVLPLGLPQLSINNDINNTIDDTKLVSNHKRSFAVGCSDNYIPSKKIKSDNQIYQSNNSDNIAPDPYVPSTAVAGGIAVANQAPILPIITISAPKSLGGSVIKINCKAVDILTTKPSMLNLENNSLTRRKSRIKIPVTTSTAKSLLANLIIPSQTAANTTKQPRREKLNEEDKCTFSMGDCIPKYEFNVNTVLSESIRARQSINPQTFAQEVQCCSEFGLCEGHTRINTIYAGHLKNAGLPEPGFPSGVSSYPKLHERYWIENEKNILMYMAPNMNIKAEGHIYSALADWILFIARSANLTPNHFLGFYANQPRLTSKININVLFDHQIALQYAINLSKNIPAHADNSFSLSKFIRKCQCDLLGFSVPNRSTLLKFQCAMSIFMFASFCYMIKILSFNVYISIAAQTFASMISEEVAIETLHTLSAALTVQKKLLDVFPAINQIWKNIYRFKSLLRAHINSHYEACAKNHLVLKKDSGYCMSPNLQAAKALQLHYSLPRHHPLEELVKIHNAAIELDLEKRRTQGSQL